MADNPINSDLKEVERKYAEFGNKDPFSEIEPSLLNSADIYDYVEKTGMISPFYPENLKPASYGIKLKGEYVYWESTQKKVSGRLEDISEKDEDGDVVFTLKRNSIIYVQLEPHFKLPSYIAGRFNLKIKHIYQGVLLGTGPLVDPGYEGSIYAPLHNLTNNDYKIKLHKPFVWMEFTKLSSNSEWADEYNKSPNRAGKYIPFDKKRLNEKTTLSQYINDAFPNAPIVSTISGFFEETNKIITDFGVKIRTNENNVQNATDGVNRATTQFNRAIIVAVIAICVTLGLAIYQGITIHNKTIDYLKDSDKRQADEYAKFMKEQAESISLKKISELI